MGAAEGKPPGCTLLFERVVFYTSPPNAVCKEVGITHMARNNSSPIQQFRGTTAQHKTYKGLPGELTVDTDKHVVVVHDGSTAGGHPTVPDKFLLKSTGGILTFNDGAEAPLQGDSIAVEIDLTALEDALGGSLTAGEGITITEEGVIQVDQEWLGGKIPTNFADLPLYFTGMDEAIHTVLASEWNNVTLSYIEADGAGTGGLQVLLSSESGANPITLNDSPQALGALKGKAVKLAVTGMTNQSYVSALVRFTA